MLLGLYSQHFIFFVTFYWAQKARVVYYTRLERLVRDKHSSLVGPLISFKRNEVLYVITTTVFLLEKQC